MSIFEKTLMIFGFLMLGLITAVTANRAVSDDDMQTKIIFKELKASIKDLYQSKTIPLTEKIVSDLESQLSSNDLAELESLRIRMNELKKLRKAEKKALKEQIEKYEQAGLEYNVEEIQDRYSKYLEEYDATLQKISAFADRHYALLSKLHIKYRDELLSLQKNKSQIVELWQKTYSKELCDVPKEVINKKFEKIEKKAGILTKEYINTNFPEVFIIATSEYIS